MELFAGIDGGGTTTRVAVHVLGTHQTHVLDGGPSRLSLLGFDRSVDCIIDLLTRGTAYFGAELGNLTAVSVCLSGVDSTLQSEELRRRLQSRLPMSFVEAVNDAFAALAAGVLGRVGVAVIGGTGSIAVGERNDGFIARAGGYGSVLGDEGSGYDIGRQGITAAIRAFEHRGPDTMLWRRVAQHFKIASPLELVDEIYESEVSVSRVASFAGNVLEAAGEKDDVAEGIVKNAIEAYAYLVKSVRVSLHDTLENRVVLAGGLFQNYPIIRERLQELLPDDTLHTLKRPPVLGALLRAFDLAKRNSPSPFADLNFNEEAWIDSVTPL